MTPFNPATIPNTQIPNPPRSVAQTADNILAESAGLNDRKKSIAVYWSDRPGSETPPGHWNLIAQWLSRRHRHALDQDANGSMLGASATVRKGTSFVEPATDTRAGVPAADVTISWHTFEDAANEAGLSRRYGIHWQLGRRLGLARSTAWSDPSLAWSGQG